jgi:hypothetical protein
MDTHHDHEKVIRNQESRQETPPHDSPSDQLVQHIVYASQLTSPMDQDGLLNLPHRLRSAIANLGDLQIMAEYITPPAITPQAIAPATNTFLSG